MKKQDKKTTNNINEIYKEMDKIYTTLGFNFKRNSTDYLRKKSADIFVEGKDNNYLILTEKVAMSYIDKELNTYAFEIQSQKNADTQGWLFNEEIMNTHFCLIYPKSKTNDVNNLDSIEVIIVSKEKVRNFVEKSLKRKSLKTDKILSEVLRLGKEFPDMDRIFINLNNDAKIVWSKNMLPERPINCVISKLKLKDLADIVIKKDMKKQTINLFLKADTKFKFML